MAGVKYQKLEAHSGVNDLRKSALAKLEYAFFISRVSKPLGLVPYAQNILKEWQSLREGP